VEFSGERVEAFASCGVGHALILVDGGGKGLTRTRRRSAEPVCVLPSRFCY
jgi:hypothetical protein